MGLVVPWHVESSPTRDRTCALAGVYFTTEPPGNPQILGLLSKKARVPIPALPLAICVTFVKSLL